MISNVVKYFLILSSFFLLSHSSLASSHFAIVGEVTTDFWEKILTSALTPDDDETVSTEVTNPNLSEGTRVCLSNVHKNVCFACSLRCADAFYLKRHLFEQHRVTVSKKSGKNKYYHDTYGELNIVTAFDQTDESGFVDICTDD